MRRGNMSSERPKMESGKHVQGARHSPLSNHIIISISSNKHLQMTSINRCNWSRALSRLAVSKLLKSHHKHFKTSNSYMHFCLQKALKNGKHQKQASLGPVASKALCKLSRSPDDKKSLHILR